eukprot:c19650_g1_i1 orf=2-1054(-)
MPKHRHDHHTHVTRPAETDHGSRGCSSQQAAAAWAWLQHGGGTCITPSRAEGLMAANLNAKCKLARPSRFKLELILANTAVPDHSTVVAEDAAAKGQPKRRHSFHDAPARRPTVDSFGSRCRTTAATSARWTAKQLIAADLDQDVIKDNGASSLLDKFELEEIWRQLVGISTPSSKTEQPECAVEAVDSSTAQLKSHRRHLHRSSDDLSTHKSAAGGLWKGISARLHHHHHHHSDDHRRDQTGHGAADLLHQLLHLRITASGRFPAPALCSSVATVNSISDHQQSGSPRKLRAHVHDVKLQERLKYDRDTTDQKGWVRSKHSGIHLTILEPAGEGIAADHDHGKVKQMPAQ